MKHFNNFYKDKAYLIYRYISPIFDPRKAITSIPGYIGFLRDLAHYRKMDGAEHISISHLYPVLNDKTNITTFDKHYFYQDTWAFKHILKRKPKWHVDVGSRVDFIGFLTSITYVAFVEIRPVQAKLAQFGQIQGDILCLPFLDNSILSLSCLHVAEHIGLGRYGDRLNPHGTLKACKELSRVLAPNGDLYFSLPVGKPKLCFNAHRIHAPTQIMQYFEDLTLINISCVNDEGMFIENASIDSLELENYACGFFHFTKPQNS